MRPVSLAIPMRKREHGAMRAPHSVPFNIIAIKNRPGGFLRRVGSFLEKKGRYLPTSAGNRPVRAFSCSSLVARTVSREAFGAFVATPSYLRASMILSSAASMIFPLFNRGIERPYSLQSLPLKSKYRIMSSLLHFNRFSALFYRSQNFFNRSRVFFTAIA